MRCNQRSEVACSLRHLYKLLMGRGGGGAGAGGSSLKNLHAMVVGVSHDDAPVAVDGDAAIRFEELSVA